MVVAWGWAGGSGWGCLCSLRAGTSFIQVGPPHTPLLGQRCPPTNFSGQRETGAGDWRIKFDLKEFFLLSPMMALNIKKA